MVTAANTGKLGANDGFSRVIATADPL